MPETVDLTWEDSHPKWVHEDDLHGDRFQLLEKQTDPRKNLTTERDRMRPNVILLPRKDASKETTMKKLVQKRSQRSTHLQRRYTKPTCLQKDLLRRDTKPTNLPRRYTKTTRPTPWPEVLAKHPIGSSKKTQDRIKWLKDQLRSRFPTSASTHTSWKSSIECEAQARR